MLTTLSGLTLKVIKPALAGPNSKLPVVVVRAYQTWSGYVLNSFTVDFWRFIVQYRNGMTVLMITPALGGFKLGSPVT